MLQERRSPASFVLSRGARTSLIDFLEMGSAECQRMAQEILDNGEEDWREPGGLGVVIDLVLWTKNPWCRWIRHEDICSMKCCTMKCLEECVRKMRYAFPYRMHDQLG